MMDATTALALAMLASVHVIDRLTRNDRKKK